MEEGEEEDEEEDVILHSSSAADLFTAFYEFLKFFQKLKGLRTPQNTKSFANAISSVVKDYVSKVQSLCFEEMNQQVDDASKDFSAYVELSKEMKKRLDRGDKGVLTIKKQVCPLSHTHAPAPPLHSSTIVVMLTNSPFFLMMIAMCPYK